MPSKKDSNRAPTESDLNNADRLVPELYQELRSIASRQLRGERDGHTFNTTDLVHEAYLKLNKIDKVQWNDRAHFCAMASRSMRRILIDYAKRRSANKRGGGLNRVTFEEQAFGPEQTVEGLISFDEALTLLQEKDEVLAKIVEYRFFGGMTMKEISQVLELPERTCYRSWDRAKAYIKREIAQSSPSA